MSPPKKKFRTDEDDEAESKTYDYSTLPYDVLVNIFSYLDFKTISQCGMLCRTFYEVSNESIIYREVVFKYNMDKNLLENYISKITRPKHLSIEYKFFNNESECAQEDYAEFDNYVVRFLKKSGTSLQSIHFNGCRNENILSLVSECPQLTDISFYRCKGTFQSLPQLKNLTKIKTLLSIIPDKVFQETLENNPQLKILWLSDNSLNPSDVCEALSKYNALIEEVHLSEKKKLRARGIKALARCPKLRILELTGGPYHCDPEDSLQQIAAGCPLLEKLTLYGWKEVDDETILPILHSCTQLKELDLRGVNITIKSCREAALSLPFLHTLDVYKCHRIKKSEILKLQKDFQEIRITGY